MMATKYEIKDGKLLAVSSDCSHCYEGTLPAEEPCKECNGTGKTKKGKGKGTCRKCYGSKTQYNQEKRVTCTHCNGNWQDAEKPGRYINLPDGMWEKFEFKVIRQNREISFNESMLGFGCIYSCQDYGDAWKENNDAKLIEEVKKQGSHSATAILDDEFNLPKFIGIFVSRGGYSVRAVHNEVVTRALVHLERGHEEGMAVGVKLASEGMNGTAFALFKTPEELKEEGKK